MFWPLLIVIVTILAVALLGQYFVSKGLKRWYKRLVLPPYTPSGMIIGIVWIVLYILTAISLYLFLKAAIDDPTLWLVMSIFILNGFLNVLWNYTFFTSHHVYSGYYVALAIAVTVLCLMVLILPVSMISALLLLPYFLWVCFASYLNYQIWVSNGFRMTI